MFSKELIDLPFMRNNLNESKKIIENNENQSEDDLDD